MRNKINKKLFYVLSAGAAVAAPIAAVVSCGSNHKIAASASTTELRKTDEDDAKAKLDAHKAEVQKQIDTAPIVAHFNGTESDFNAASDADLAAKISIQQQPNIVFEIKSAAKTATGISLSVLVKSSTENDDTVAKERTATIAKADLGFKQILAADVDAKIQALATTFVPTLKNGVENHTASKLVATDFETVQKNADEFADMDIKCEVIGFPSVSLSNTDGSVARIKIKISSSIPGTTPAIFFKEISGLKTTKAFDAMHGTASSSGFFNPVNFDDIKADGVSWTRGVAWQSQAQGISFFFNLAKKLGWHEVADAASLPAPLDKYASMTYTPVSQPLQDAIIDPSGSDGTMSANWLEPFGWAATASLGNWTSGNWITPGHYGSGANVIYVPHFALYIDGSGTTASGKLISKAWLSHDNKATFVKTNVSAENTIRTYDKISVEEEDRITSLLLSTIANLKGMVSSIDMAKSYINADFLSLLKFIAANDSGITNDKIQDAVKSLNNGSHHMQAVEAFLRGIHGIPSAEQPSGNHANLDGLSVMKNALSLTNWFHYTTDHHSYTKPVVASPVAPADTIYSN